MAKRSTVPRARRLKDTTSDERFRIIEIVSDAVDEQLRNDAATLGTRDLDERRDALRLTAQSLWSARRVELTAAVTRELRVRADTDLEWHIKRQLLFLYEYAADYYA